MFCGGEEQPVPGDATFNKEGDGQKLLAPAVHGSLGGTWKLVGHMEACVAFGSLRGT